MITSSRGKAKITRKIIENKIEEGTHALRICVERGDYGRAAFIDGTITAFSFVLALLAQEIEHEPKEDDDIQR